MSDAAKLIDLVMDSAGLFAETPPDKEKLKQALTGLNAFIVVSETGYPPEVTDNIWQGARKLKKAIDSPDDIPVDELGAIYEQLITAIDALDDEEEPVVVDESEEEPEVYTIPEDDISLIEDFIIEAGEHLEASEGAMLELETHVEDSDTLNLIFRGFHTIKGMAGFMNLAQIGALSHDAETLLDLARKGERVLCGTNADAIFSAIDMLKSMVDDLRDAIEGNCIVTPKSGIRELIKQIRSCVDGTDGDVVVEKAEPVALENETPEVVERKEEGESLTFEEATPAVAPVIEVKKDVPPVAAEAPASAAQNSSSQRKKTSSQVEEKIKVSTDRLDSLVNMVGELVIAQLMVTESLKSSAINDNGALLRNTAHQSKIIRELQELSMSMRMVPIGGVFQKMARMVRDLSRQAGKNIEFSLSGEQTELDRTIVDKLADPLIHMIRNSVDHGVEDPEERKTTGKSKSGHVELRAFHLAGNIVIEIEDDGRGLNRERILNKARERGVISGDKTPSDSEIFSLIFHPGFSTAEKVTSVSGRGVGMDVVKRNIEELSGRIDIASKQGEGTIFTITLPLTLAIIDGQVVQVGEERYIIPINSIVKSFRPVAEQISTVQGMQEVVMERDKLLPLVRLHELFGIEANGTNPTEGLVMIVEEENQACCLLVDDLLDQQQVVIKSLGDGLKSTAGISGGAILGDGMVRLILDIPGILKMYKE